jgi:hypothetical protein
MKHNDIDKPLRETDKALAEFSKNAEYTQAARLAVAASQAGSKSLGEGFIREFDENPLIQSALKGSAAQ